MIITIDIGNTIIDVGVFQDERIVERVKISTDKSRTKFEYKSLLFPYLSPFKKNIEGAIISSVVPQLTQRFIDLSKEEWGYCLEVNSKLSTGVKILYKKVEELGADRIANAVAVTHYYSLPAVVVDFGTALTIEVVEEGKKYLGGMIIPGISISLNSLYEKTSLLSPVKLSIPSSLIGESTKESIQSGIIYGYASLIEGIVRRLSDFLKKEPKVIFTGGESSLISPVVKINHVLDTLLTLKGLKKLFEMNNGGKNG